MWSDFSNELVSVNCRNFDDIICKPSFWKFLISANFCFIISVCCGMFFLLLQYTENLVGCLLYLCNVLGLSLSKMYYVNLTIPVVYSVKRTLNTWILKYFLTIFLSVYKIPSSVSWHVTLVLWFCAQILTILHLPSYQLLRVICMSFEYWLELFKDCYLPWEPLLIALTHELPKPPVQCRLTGVYDVSLLLCHALE